MAKKTYGSEEARIMLPKLLERAHHGKVSVITKRGKPYAAIVSAEAAAANRPRLPILALEGSGRGLWGDAARFVSELRDEWS